MMILGISWIQSSKSFFFLKEEKNYRFYTVTNFLVVEVLRLDHLRYGYSAEIEVKYFFLKRNFSVF
jgi:hypothetical protein